MLAVAALEIRYPVMFVVLMESDDVTLHDSILEREHRRTRRNRFHAETAEAQRSHGDTVLRDFLRRSQQPA